MTDHLTLLDHLLTAISEGTATDEWVQDWTVAYEAETGDQSLKGCSAAELYMSLLGLATRHNGSAGSVSATACGPSTGSLGCSKGWPGGTSISCSQNGGLYLLDGLSISISIAADEIKRFCSVSKTASAWLLKSTSRSMSSSRFDEWF